MHLDAPWARMKQVSATEALRLGQVVGIDFERVPLEAFRRALEIEASRPLVADDVELAAHLAKERVEREAEAQDGSSSSVSSWE